MTDTTENTQAESPSTETLNTENHVPQSRFNQVISEKKALERQLADLAKAQSEKENQTLAEQNRYKELYEKLLSEHEPLKQSHEKATRYQTALESSNQARLQRIPEDKRSLIPEYDDPVKLGEWLDRNASLISEASKPIAPNLNGAAGGGGSARESASSVSPAVQGLLDIARQNGYSVNPERVAQFAKNPTKQSNTGE